MTDVTTNFDDFAGLEKMNYNRFYTANVVRRPNQAPTKFDPWSTLQLPTGSVLHSLDGFANLEPAHEGLPDTTLPPLANEKLPIWLQLVTQLAHEDSQPFGISENYTYRPAKMSSQITHFFQTHRHQFHRVLSARTLSTMSNVLTWIDYSPLNEVRVGGTLHAYRKFDLLFRTILDTVVGIGNGKHHYILLPQGDHVFPRSIMQRSFRELTTGTLNTLSHDPSVFPLIHLLGYVYGKTKELSVVPYKEDVKLLGKSNPLYEKLRSTSLFERIDPALFSSINFILQKDNKAVIYNLADIDRFADDATFYTKLFRHMMNLRLSNSVLPDHIDPDSDEFDHYVAETAGASHDEQDDHSENPVTTTKVETVHSAPVIAPVGETKTPTVKADTPHPDAISHTEAAPKSFEERLRRAAHEHTATIVQAEPKKESRRDQLIDAHLKATLAGRPLGELIQAPSTQSISPKSMTFITSTPEASYQKSSLVAMDRAYQTHAYHHEMAKVVGSLAKHGMFISRIEEEKTNTEMDRTTTYRLHLADLAGKTHHVRFTIPDVDDNGMMKLSGIEYRLTRQIANVPICKVSPVRVNLSSYYNKINVERVQSKRYSYEEDTAKLIMSLRSSGQLKAVIGNAPLPTKSVAYDYTAIGRKFTEILVGGYDFFFSGDHAPYPADLHPKLVAKMGEWETKYGIYVGNGPERNQLLFWNITNEINLVKDGELLQSWRSFHRFLADILGEPGIPARTPLEWTQANIINQTIPLVFILAYRFGLKAVLDMIKLDYRFYSNRNEVEVDIDDIVVPMADGTLVFNRYPLARSLIACGLTWADLRSFQFRDLSVPDTYALIFNQKRISGVGVLKGLRGFFDFFVDPITESVLEKMGEPITFGELLLRANVMLTDYQADESSSVKLHRFRLYERFNGILYNEIYRALSNHRNNPTTKKSFSINPEAVFQKIVQDATVSPNDMINPVHEIKQRALFTYTGGGGRMGRSFTPKDLIYPQDGLGVISESVPDSGKVGINSYLSASPNIDDIHGLPKPYKPGDTLEPPQILSIGSMVMPGGTTDDGKRANYLGIQISHYVPNHNDGETLAVRTGYDAVLPHLSSGVFAISAEDRGIVESIDDKQQVLKVRYADKPTESLRSLKVPYLDTVLDTYRRNETSFGFLVPDTEISNYPLGGVFDLSKTTYGKIADRLRCETVDAIPDKEIARKQNNLIQDLIHHKYKALYYIRFTPLGSKTPGDTKSYSFADVYSQNSGAYLLQKLTPNVKVGESFKTGDILVYNPGFFVPDPMSKQVTFKHGVVATVALVEKSSNHEDACEISRGLSDRLKMTPCHQRDIVTKNDAVILGMVKVGDHVETSDSLCVISDDYLVGSSSKLNIENLDIVEKLNRQTPPADYTGTIRKIRILYGCDRDKLSESLKAILKTYEREVRDNFKALNTDPAIKPPEKPGWVAPGTKYQGIDFTNTTVILEFMIEETLDVWEGDKLCFANANKSITAYVAEKQHFTESGASVDALFSTTSIINRIVNSPFNGIAERNLQALKRASFGKVFRLNFDKK